MNIKRNISPVPQEVKEHVKQYLSKEVENGNDLGELIDVMRASEHPEDHYLYHVITRKPNTRKLFHNGEWNYSCFTCWNETTQSLNFGHYHLESEEEARESLAKHLHKISGTNVID